MAKAIIGQPTESQKIQRHAARIVRLQEAIQKAEGKGNEGKAESCKAELEARYDELRAIKAALEAAGV